MGYGRLTERSRKQLPDANIFGEIELKEKIFTDLEGPSISFLKKLNSQKLYLL